MTALFDLFCDLVQIPSPSLGEENVAKFILSFFENNEIEAFQDAFGNVYVKVPATDKTKSPLMLSAHMDVVGDSSKVNIKIKDNLISTDGKRTLGADDKAGVAVAMMVAKKISESENLLHGGLEIAFTKDEEQSMSGVKALNFKAFSSQYILVLDADCVGDVLVSGAGFVKMMLKVKGLKGGHSGIDIADETRVNAVKLIADVVSALPQGVFEKDETGVVTSLNVGAVVGGGVKNLHTDLQGEEFSAFLTKNAMSNVINTDASALYSLRSSSKDSLQRLIEQIKNIVESFNQKYENKAQISLEFEEQMPAFEKSQDTAFLEIAKKAAKKIDLALNVSSFHAGAETHIYANQKNAKDELFKPYLVGVANIFDMHAGSERMEINSLDKGFDFVEKLFFTFNEIV